MSQNSKRDLRSYARQTSVRLIIGGLVLLFVVGGGLIWLIEGRAAALSGLLCMGVGLVPLLLIGIVLWVINWVARRANPD